MIAGRSAGGQLNSWSASAATLTDHIISFRSGACEDFSVVLRLLSTRSDWC